MLALNNVTTADSYTDANTIVLSSAQTLSFVVANAAVYAQFKPHDPIYNNEREWGDEILLTPQTNVVRRVSGFRVRSAVASVPAQVIAQLLDPGEPSPDAGSPFSAYLASSGAVSSTLAMETGDIIFSARAAARAGTLACDGTHYDAVADPTLENLWNEIGITFGGTAKTDFAVPDMPGRTVVVRGTHADVDTVGKSDGLAVGSRRPKHKTSIVDPGHLHGGVRRNDGINGPNAGVDPGSNTGNTNAAVTGITAGPQTGSEPTDTPAFIVLNAYIVK